MTTLFFPSTRNNHPHPSPSTATPNTSSTRSLMNASGMGAHSTSPIGREKAWKAISGYQPPNSRLVWPSTVGSHNEPTPNSRSPYPSKANRPGRGVRMISPLQHLTRDIRATAMSSVIGRATSIGISTSMCHLNSDAHLNSDVILPDKRHKYRANDPKIDTHFF